MKIKKFTARTFAEALAQVKKELSENAIILSTEEKKGLFPQVEVTAAIDYDQDAPPAAGTQYGPGTGLQDIYPAPRMQPVRGLDRGRSVPGTSSPEDRSASFIPAPVIATRAVPTASVAAPEPAGISELRTELGSLRTMIEDMKCSGFELSLPPKKRAVVKFLRDRAIREDYALRISDRAGSVNEVPSCLAPDLKVKHHQGTKKAVMLIGPTGVGKTTTLAKLAAHAIRSGKKAAFINLDTFRIGAVEQIRIYARILGVPLAVAANLDEFRTSLKKFSETRDVVFIDTVGRNPRDADYIAEMTEVCRTSVPLELHLLMGANADEECMVEAYRSYRSLPIDFLGFTKVDEAVRYGSLYNLMLTYQKPVAYITTGQQVPADIEFPTVNRLTDLIVGAEHAA